MISTTDKLKELLTKLDLDSETADLYMALYIYGPQTITGLARVAKVERTKIYRLLDKLTAANLIEVENQYKRVILHAAPITNLSILLTQRQQENQELGEAVQLMHEELAQTPQNHLTQVRYYRGPEGSKQMLWNQTKAKGETLAILHEPMQTKTNLLFFERWVRSCNEHGWHFRGLVSDHFLERLQDWYKHHHNERLEHWEPRYLSPDILPITHSIVTYEDVVAYHHWKDGEVFGLEVRNAEAAETQRHVFEVLWAQAIPVPDELNWVRPGK